MNGPLIQYEEPFRSFRFQIEVECEGAVVAKFTQFSGIQMEVQTIQARSGNDIRGVQEYVPVMTSFAPVTLTQGVIGDNQFLDWILSAAADVETGPTGGDQLRRTLNIIALDDIGNPGVIWSLRDAFPIGYQLAPMDGGRSEVLSESLTFAIGGMQRITRPPKERPPRESRKNPYRKPSQTTARR